jgi:hypothetical protein
VKLTVSIDRIVLDGVQLTPAQRAALPAAVQAELRRLLAGGPVATSPNLRSASPVTRIGADVASAVAGALPAARRRG